jgi:hypothetical protein
MKCDSRASLLAHTFVNPYLGCKPKVKVATIMMTKAWILFLQLFFKTNPIALRDSKPQKLRLQI